MGPTAPSALIRLHIQEFDVVLATTLQKWLVHPIEPQRRVIQSRFTTSSKTSAQPPTFSISALAADHWLGRHIIGWYVHDSAHCRANNHDQSRRRYVPQDAALSDVDIISLSITSAGSGYSLSDTTRVMAGEFLQATVDVSNDTTYVLPGKTDTIGFNVTNTGNAPASFNLLSGLSMNALNWNHNISIENTGELLQVGQTVSGFIHVEVPSINSRWFLPSIIVQVTA